MTNYVLTEFGRNVLGPKELFGEEPFPPKDGEEASPHMNTLLNLLDYDFQKAKAEYFPHWEDSTYELKEGPLYSSLTIVRKDGEKVPDDIYDAWSAWYHWNEDGEEEGTQPQFTYP
jgi:hypothetical protein